MPKIIAGLVAGLLFGAGLALSGMTDPAVVLGFLDLAGAWNPALLLVMAAALAVAVPGSRWALGRPRPLLAERFSLPATTAIDRPLILGAALFGIGWGLGGYCPGPAVAALTAMWPGTLVFLAAALAGLALARRR